MVFGLLVALIVAVSTDPSSTIRDTTTNITFEQAQQDVSLRQMFIDQVVQELGKPENVSRVIYAARDEIEKHFGSGKPGMKYHATERIKGFGPSQVPIEIVVFPVSFSTSPGRPKTREDLISSLEHEYHHARQLREGRIRSWPFTSFPEVNGKKYYTDVAKELDAYANQLATTGSKVSRPFYEATRGNYIKYYATLWDAYGEIGPQFISMLKVEFFPDWTLSGQRTVDFITQVHYLPIVDTETGEVRYIHFTPEEIQQIKQKADSPSRSSN